MLEMFALLKGLDTQALSQMGSETVSQVRLYLEAAAERERRMIELLETIAANTAPKE